MLLFVSSIPLIAKKNGYASAPMCNRPAQVTQPRHRTRPVTSQASPQPEPSPRPADSTSSPSLQDELRLLLDPTLNSSARQILAQDMLARVPEALRSFASDSSTPRSSASNESSSNPSSLADCPLVRDLGLSDLARQFTDDVLPDLLANGPRYVARAVDELPNAVNRYSTSSSGTTPPSTSANVPLSSEVIAEEVRNIFNRTPEGLYTPQYEVLLKRDHLELRRYPTLILAQTQMAPRTDDTSSVTEVESAAAMGSSFSNLADYLFGNNESKAPMKMTTPVFLDKQVDMVEGKVAPSEESHESKSEMMSFIIGEYDNLSDVPKAVDDTVELVEVPGGVYAAVEFTGFVTQGEARRQRERIMALLEKEEGIRLAPNADKTFKCLIYNGPSTLPNLRRNEILVEVEYGSD